MKPIILLLTALLFCPMLAHAQTQEEIDEALRFYPLEVGNYWEYESINEDSSPNWRHHSIEVVGDTVLASGQVYKIMRTVNQRTLYVTHYEFNVSFNEHGQRVAYYLERVDQQTANIYKWNPLPEDPFNDIELLADSLLVPIGAEIFASRWPSGENTRRVEDSIYDDMGFIIPSINFEFSSAAPFNYTLADGFGLVSFNLEKLVYFRDHLGNEFGEPVNVSSPSEPEVPQRANLFSNYPNPFNPSTVIPFELGEAVHVRLEVYDMLGRRVALLVNETRQAGSHSAQFDATNLPSGVYIARLQTENSVYSQKMMLVK